MPRTIVITGASEGLGYELSKLLHQDGDNELVLIAENEAKLKKAATELKSKYYVCDVSDYVQVRNTSELIIKDLGKIDVLVNNAGVFIQGELESNSYEEIKRVIDINTLGTMYFCKALMPAIKKSAKGTILNTVSQAGLHTKGEREVYNASKWAITGFTESLRDELSKYNIRVMGIYPALINTSLFDKIGVKKDMSLALGVTDVAKIMKFMLDFENINFDKVVIRHTRYH